MAGDYNMVMEPSKDRRGSLINNVKAYGILCVYMEEMGIVDICRAWNPDDFQFTWYTLSPNPIFFRLDMILTNIGICDM